MYDSHSFNYNKKLIQNISINRNWLKYLSPLIGILFCPVTILFLWTIWSEPSINSEIDSIEKVIP